MIFNANTPAEIARQIAVINNILLRNQVRLNNKVRREIIRLWREYLNLDRAVQVFEENTAKILQEAYEGAAQEFGEHLDVEMQASGAPSSVLVPVIAGMAAFFQLTSRQAAQGISDVERKNILRRAEIYAAEGLSQREIASQIRAFAPAYSAPRAELIAETEVARAADRYTKDSLEQSGLNITRKQWVDAGDGRVRPTHEAADGQERPYNQPYTVGGYQMMEPRDGSMGAPLSEVLRCRCVSNYFTD